MRQSVIMQITKFSDYALRILIHLSAADGRRETAGDIARHQGVSFNHLAKVSQWLAAEGYVEGTRGRGGGIVLARPAEEISIGALLRKSEAGSALVECMRADGGACPLTPACGLTGLLAGAQEAFFAYLDDKTLADVIDSGPAVLALIRGMAASETDNAN